MKFVKLSIFALSMGLFVASCGESDSASETTDTTSATMTTPEPAPMTVDTTMAPPADTTMADTTHAAH